MKLPFLDQLMKFLEWTVDNRGACGNLITKNCGMEEAAKPTNHRKKFVFQPAMLMTGFGTSVKSGVNSHQYSLIIGEWPLFYKSHPSALSADRFTLVSNSSVHQLATCFYPGMCMSRYNVQRIATQVTTILQQSMFHLNKSNKQLRAILSG